MISTPEGPNAIHRKHCEAAIEADLVSYFQRKSNKGVNR